MGTIEILRIVETKTYASFPISQFSVEGYCKPYAQLAELRYKDVIFT